MSAWTLIQRIQGGHKYWRRADGKVGISDDSGSNPDRCEPADRPPLLLDCTRPIVIGSSCTIPITDNQGSQKHTVASGYEALWVALQFGLEIAAAPASGASPIRCRVVVSSGAVSESVGKAQQVLAALEGR